MRFTGRTHRTITAATIAFLAIAMLPMATAQDTQQPAAESATMIDSDGDGRLDSVEMVFTHAMDDATIRAGDFRIGGAPATGFNSGDTDDDTSFTLTFPPGAAPDTGETPSLDYTRGTATGANGEPLGTIESPPFSRTDGAAPQILGAMYESAGSTVTVVFSEAPVVVDGNLADNDDFCVVDGQGDTVALTGQSLTGHYVELTLPSALTTPADATVAAVTGGTSCGSDATVQDGAAVPNPAPIDSIAIQDTIATQTVVGGVGSDQLTVTFDFPVDGTGDSDEMVPDDFTLDQFDTTDGPVTIAAVDHTAGSEIAVLTLSRPLTDADFSSPAEVSASVQGHGTGVTVDTTPVAVEDTEGPRLLSATTLDVGGTGGAPNGRIDAIRLTFSENLNTDTIDEEDFVVHNGLTIVAFDGAVASDDGTTCEGTLPSETLPIPENVMYLCVDDDAAMHGGVLPAVSFDPSESAQVDGPLADPAGNVADAFSHQIATDGVAPLILTATTMDSGGRLGFIDGYRVVFSEPMDDGTFDETDWEVGGTSSSGFDTGSTDNDATWVLRFEEGSGPDTGETPELTYAVGTDSEPATDRSGQELGDIGDTGVDEEDGAPPALVSAITSAGSTSVELTFSEGVRKSGGGGIGSAQLEYRDVDAGGATDIDSVSHTADSDTATVTVDEEVEDDDLDSDWIRPLSGVVDAANLAASELLNRRPLTTSAPSDTSNPGAMGTVTVEATGSDSATLSWSAPGDDGSTGTVTGYIVKTSSSAITTDGFDSATTVADADLSFDPAAPAAAGDTQELTISGLSGSDPIHFALRAVDDVGRVGAPSTSVDVSLDSDAPGSLGTVTASAEDANSVELSFTAPGDDGTTGTVTGYEVRRSGSAITGSNVDDAAAEDNLTFDPETLVAAGSTQAVTVGALVPSSTYFFAVRAVDDAGNEGPWSFTSSVTTDDDDTPPEGTLTITSSTHPEETPVASDAPEFEWNTLDDPESDVTYRYAFDQDADHVLDSDDLTQTGTSISFTGVEPGRWYLHVRGESAGGESSQATYGIDVRAAVDVAGANEDLQLTLVVDRDGSDNVLHWSIGSLDDPPEGIQVWRATSPFAIIATLQQGEGAFNDTEYRDADAPAGARYIITAFYGDTNALGFAADGDDLTDLPGYTGLSDEELDDLSKSRAVADEGGLSRGAVIALVVLVVVIIIAIVIAIVLAGRKRGDKATGDETWEEVDDWDAPHEDVDDWGTVQDATYGAPQDDADDWGTVQDATYGAPREDAEDRSAAQEARFGPPEPGDTADEEFSWAGEEEKVDLTCPRCDHDFTAVGVRPIKTTCPDCGVRGTLP